MKTIRLGNTGIETSYLCIGTGSHGWNHSSNQTRMGFDKCVDMLVYAYERGITFWDSADQYGSHPHVAAAFRQVPREKVVLTTKTVAKDAASAHKDIERFRQELGTDYLDLVLLHCMGNANWNEKMRPVMDTLSEYREKGVIRAVGCSNHDFGALKTAADEPWVETVLVRLNYAGATMDEHPDHVVPVVRKMVESGKGVYSMKTVGGGDLRSEYRACVKWVHDLNLVHAIVLGMESRQEVDANVDYLESLLAETPTAPQALRRTAEVRP